MKVWTPAHTVGRNPAPNDMLNIPLFTGLAYIPGGDCQMSSINSIKVSTFWRFHQPQINLFVLPIPPAASNLSFLVLNTQLHGNFLKKSRGEGPHPQNLRFFSVKRLRGKKYWLTVFVFQFLGLASGDRLF